MGGPATLFVNVADLLHRPGARRRVQLSSPVEALLPARRVVSSAVPDRSDVDLDAMLEWVSDGVLATVTVTAPWEAECRRCLSPVRGWATGAFQELFEPRAREGETYPLTGDRIDLAPLARETLLLELPLAPLCREDCAGLCPECGADRNAGPCGCAPVARDARWAALDELLGNGDD